MLSGAGFLSLESKAGRVLKSMLHSLFDLAKDNKRLFVIGAATLALLGVVMDVKATDLANIDNAAYVFFVLHLRRAWLTPIMETISSLASPVILAVMLLVVQAFAPGRRPGVCAAINLVSAVVIDLVMKEIVQRPRPDESIRLVSETGYSFPSGHSMVSMAFYGLLLWMVWRYEKDVVVKWTCMAGFAAVILLVGISRIYLGVHYASDVLAGFCVSAVWLTVYTKVAVPVLLDEGEEGELTL